MAEEYYYKTYPVTLNIGEEERKKEVTDIFLAGLKAGRPQWHKVADGDLPKKELWNKQLLLLVDRNGLPPCFVVGYYEESEVLEDYEKNWGWYNIAENVAYDFIDNEISVLKWKEIE